MTALRHQITAWLGGELNPLLAGRVDTDQYAYGLATCENFACINEGPLVKRPGFYYLNDADPTSAWLGSFRFSITQEYAIEWGAIKARFYTNGARIETAPGVAYETVTPYAAADCAKLSSQQSYDRLYIDHVSYAPGALTRTSSITFTHATTTLRNGPFEDLNADDAITVSAAGVFTVAGAVTLTSSSAIFAASDVGAQFRLEAQDFSTIKAWQPGMTGVAIGNVVRSDGKAYTAATAGTTGTIPPTHEEGSEWDGQGLNDLLNLKGPYGVQWTYRHDRVGTVRITGFTSATQVSATVLRRIPDGLATVASPRWAHGSFSATRGWPGVVVHGFGRQIHFKQFDVNGSVVDDYGGGQCNFETKTSQGLIAADLGFRRTLSESDPPLWAVSDLRLLAGTAGRELAIGAQNDAAAVSGDNLRSEPQSFYGAEAVWPVQLGTELVFVERGGRRIRSAGYDFSQGRYVSSDLTAGCRHLTKPGVVQLVGQRTPNALLYAVLGPSGQFGGQILQHALTRLELKGFSRTVLGGAAKALSAVSVVGADGKTDELYVLIERTRSDGVKREIWKQAAWRDLGDAQAEQMFVDGGIRVAAAASQKNFTGALHLKGQAIAVLANGAVVPGIMVSNTGTFSLPDGVAPAVPYVLMYGLKFTALAVTLRPEAKLARGATLQGLLKRVRKVAARLIETMGVSVGAVTAEGTYGELEELTDRPAGAPMDAAPPLFTGDTLGAVEMEPDRDGRVRFISEVPLNAIIPSAVFSLEVDEADA